ncbi:MAG: class A beta-lactamase-related serine hydrolase [Candidatus Abyssobacteria bacterium SURF_5]|uniref:Class A beta-lactamase-related serine hydrolase n=1 Tax=Abyssobacteria bacterium (strain SURF_5) TaxID=2093360 RepID=A0A3A4NRJ2_ABYX5|nr:MAG: class A beta-lactamase-related serine hydrolase [Candidatus Abyssubacteria bacterium SURF_5]
MEAQKVVSKEEDFFEDLRRGFSMLAKFLFSKTMKHISATVICLIQLFASQPARAGGPTDPQELEAFVDSLLSELVQEYHMPGAVFALVKDGELFFAKGYGFADLENRKPVIADTTLFRVASVSKLFTATAVMQLHEKGLLNLDDDVNKYLTLFKIDDSFPEPVTVANLLTHTGDFDERMIGKETPDESKVVPLGLYLSKHMPPRYAPPWDQYCYSNHGMALAGYLVEVVSGIPFARYVDENIFHPLGMNRSSFLRDPLLAPDIAVGYTFRDGSYQRLPYHYLYDAPAGELNMTATDMARFMIAHLQKGRFGEIRILKEATAAEMHKRQFGHHPRLPGTGYGFFEISENNQRMIGHVGGLYGHGSLMFLLPEHNVGLFLAYNSSGETGKPDVIPIFGSRFLDHYYPTGEDAAPNGPMRNSDSARFAGNYLANRYSRHTLQKIEAFFAQFRVEQTGDGTLTIHFPLNFKEPSKWVQIEPLVFQRVDGDGFVAFSEDRSGRITHMFIDAIPIQYTTKLRWYQENAFHFAIAGSSILVFLSACIAWPLRALVSRVRGRPDAGTRGNRIARLLAGFASALHVAFVLGFILIMPKAMGELYHGVPPVLIALLCVPILAAILTAGAMVFAIPAWKHGYWSVAGRLHYTLVLIGAVVFIFFLNHWNLLGFRF